jgi:AAA domain
LSDVDDWNQPLRNPHDDDGPIGVEDGSDLRRLLEALGRDPGERISINYYDRAGNLVPEITTVAGAPTAAAKYVEKDCYFGVQPTGDFKRGRGLASDVIGLRDLYADLDVKPGGMKTWDAARNVINTLSDLLGVAPVGIVNSGGGLQPHWAVERGDDTDWADEKDPRHGNAQALLRRWGRLVAHTAAGWQGNVDSVYDLSRILRVPGTTNCKGAPVTTTLELCNGAPVSLSTLDEVCDAEGVVEIPSDRRQLGEVQSAHGTWKWADETCAYADRMIAGWSEDVIKGGRHPWLIGQAIRLAAAHRYGCLAEEGHKQGAEAIAEAFRSALQTAPARALKPATEIDDCIRDGVPLAERFTDEKVAEEVGGGHVHLEPLKPFLRLVGGKDSKDWVFCVGEQAGEVVTLAETVADAVGQCGEKDGAAKLPALNVVLASEVKDSRVRYLWEGRIPLSAVTLMPGEEGIGKSTLGARIIADLTRGTLPGEFFGKPRTAMVLAAEDALAEVWIPRLRHAGADLDLVPIVKAKFTADRGETEVIVPRDFDVLSEEVERRGPALVWIDSFVTTLPDEMKSIAYKDTAKVLKGLGGWAEKHGLAVVAPWHLNKQSGSNTAIRMMDSRGFRTAIRSCLVVAADKDAPEDGAPCGIVGLDKANGASLNIPALKYTIRAAHYTVEELDEDTGEIRTHPASCSVADWTGEVEGDGRAAIREALTPRMSAADDPKEWLHEYLTQHGEVESALAKAAGVAAGFSEFVVKRAAARLNVEYAHTASYPSKSTWRLPAPSVGAVGARSAQLDHPHPAGPTGPTRPTVASGETPGGLCIPENDRGSTVGVVGPDSSVRSNCADRDLSTAQVETFATPGRVGRSTQTGLIQRGAEAGPDAVDPMHPCPSCNRPMYQLTDYATCARCRYRGVA